MNSFAYVLRPLADLWHTVTEDQDWNKQTEFKGGYGQGNAWHHKFLRFEKYRLLKHQDGLRSRFYEPTKVSDIVSDNFLRLTVFAGVERLVALR